MTELEDYGSKRGGWRTRLSRGYNGRVKDEDEEIEEAEEAEEEEEAELKEEEDEVKEETESGKAEGGVRQGGILR